ncbi:hypothetical protein H5410_057532 [Solanum commersonii]|uniref:Uncharacterized protein n=1 Tax=Solanum commersonii TaxID=4109 RepID=A0A9J5WR35_SOLCO|nr:hypothetical protein H5410_057532 [Solanum commersonii]
MVENDNYEDSSAQASDDVESSEEKTDSGDEESSRDTRDTGDEDDDPLSLPICAREISSKSYNLTTWMDELGSFPTKISVRARMTLYHDFRRLLVQEKIYNDFNGTCFGHLKHIREYFKVILALTEIFVGNDPNSSIHVVRLYDLPEIYLAQIGKDRGSSSSSPLSREQSFNDVASSFSHIVLYTKT